MKHWLALCLALGPLPAAAQSLAPALEFEGLNDAQRCQSLQPSLNYGSHAACTWNTSNQKLGRLQAVMLGTAHVVASTETRGSHVSVGSGLVYRRSDSSEGPPDCVEPCFTYQSGLDSGAMDTCFVPSAATGSRGLDRASTVAEVAAAIRGFAAAERPGGAAPYLVMEARFDMVCWAEAATQGFSPSFLVETDTGDFAAWEAWLEADTAPPCDVGAGGACSWTWSDRGASDGWNGRDVGVRLFDSITALGGNPEAYAYYLNVGDGPLHRMYAPCAVADMSDPAYRAWKLDAIEKRFLEGAFDAVLLNNKFFQYFEEDYYVLATCADNSVAQWLAGSCGGAVQKGEGFTASVADAGYGWAEYIAGWHAFGAALRARGIPYAVNTNGQFLSTSPADFYDDPSTAGVNENELMKETVYGASLVWLTDGAETPEAALACALRSRGIPYIEDDCDVEVCP